MCLLNMKAASNGLLRCALLQTCMDRKEVEGRKCLEEVSMHAGPELPACLVIDWKEVTAMAG
jgi:hypothetical protein